MEEDKRRYEAETAAQELVYSAQLRDTEKRRLIDEDNRRAREEARSRKLAAMGGGEDK